MHEYNYLGKEIGSNILKVGEGGSWSKFPLKGIVDIISRDQPFIGTEMWELMRHGH